MNHKKYWIFASLATFIVLPLWLSLSVLLSLNENLWRLPGILLLLAFPYVIYRFGKQAALPESFLPRYMPFIAPILFTLIVWIVIGSVNGGNFVAWEGINRVNYGLIVFLPFFILVVLAAFSGAFWLLPVSALVFYLLFMLCFAIGTWRSGRFKTTEKRKAYPALALILMLAFAAVIQGYVHYQSVLHPDPDYPGLWETLRGDDYWWGNFRPFQDETRLASPDTPPSLQIDRDYPKLDGAEGFVPIYAAAANVIYREGRESVNRESQDWQSDREKAVSLSYATPAAYQALLDGEADMIFALAPSEEQQKEAAAKGITYTLTPIAREAFVFLVNAQNPVTGLTVAQIRDIYSGKINDWQEVGGTPGKIMAFQRNEGSGSQTAMLRNVMRETPLRKPLEEERFSAMGGLLRGVAAYRNLGGAIGYSFRYYAVVMNSIPDIRLLAVDGVAPTVENIQNGSYPFIDDIYIVTARPLSENAQKLRAWFLSDEGQRFIAKVGYTPLKGVTH